MTGLIGSLCILCGGLFVWQSQHTLRQRRRDALADLTAALERMGEEVRMARTPFPWLLERLAGDCRPDAAALFRAAAREARRGEAPGTAWRRAAEALPLDSGDRETVRDLRLTGDEETVRKELALAAARLRRSLEALEASRGEEERRSAAVCFSASALLVILLI